MPQKTIPDNAMDVCESFLRHVLYPGAAEEFVDHVTAGNYSDAAHYLDIALSDRNDLGWPTGKRGLPSQRVVAERVLKILAPEGLSR